jgi:hypothetical protein
MKSMNIYDATSCHGVKQIFIQLTYTIVVISVQWYKTIMA